MNIVFVITGLGMGGAEKQMCLLADRLIAKNHQVSIISLTGKAIVIPDNENVKIHHLNMKKTPIGLLSGVFRLRNIISKIKPDIVHSHMFHANIMMRLTKLLSDASYKLICTAHNKYEGGKLRMFTYRLTDSLCDLNTNVSKEALDEYIKHKYFAKSKSLLVYNGIDTDKFNFKSQVRAALRKEMLLDANDKLILSVGRLNPAKDYPNLLAAFLQLPEDFKLAIIGEGEVRRDIEAIIKEHKLEKRVQLLGSISNVHDYYSACDLFVLSSAWEGFSLVVIEALACQCLAVCTDAGGVKEAFTNSDYIVPISDSRALADKILEVDEKSDELKNEIKVKNRQNIVDNFSIDSIVNNWLAIYHKVIYGSNPSVN